MENLIEKKLNALLDLQAIDCELDNITKMRGTLPEEAEDLEKKLSELQTQLQSMVEEVDHLEQSIANHRIKIKDTGTLVKKYEEQQMNVRNNREYDAITKEIDLQKLEIQLAEKKIKDTYERIEEKKVAIEQGQAAVEKNKQVLASKREELQTLTAESEGEERKLYKQRSQVTKSIEKRLLDTYERIRKNVRNRLAVVTIKKEACGGCFNQVPPQKQVEIREKKHIVACEHCGRIIADVIDPLPEE